MATIKIYDHELRREPSFYVFVNCETEIEDINFNELKSDIIGFNKYIVERYYKNEKKDWFKFWKK